MNNKLLKITAILCLLGSNASAEESKTIERNFKNGDTFELNAERDGNSVDINREISTSKGEVVKDTNIEKDDGEVIIESYKENPKTGTEIYKSKVINEQGYIETDKTVINSEGDVVIERSDTKSKK